MNWYRVHKIPLQVAHVVEIPHGIDADSFDVVVLSVLWLVDLAVRIPKYGPLYFVVYLPARFNFQEI